MTVCQVLRGSRGWQESLAEKDFRALLASQAKLENLVTLDLRVIRDFRLQNQNLENQAKMVGMEMKAYQGTLARKVFRGFLASQAPRALKEKLGIRSRALKGCQAILAPQDFQVPML
jgi:hypothetical protein